MTEPITNLSTLLPSGVFATNMSSGNHTERTFKRHDTQANDAIWILTSTFNIFTMQSGKNKHIYQPSLNYIATNVAHPPPCT